MPEINPLTNNQIFLKKIAENTGSNYETGDVSEINPLTIDQIFLKEIAANTAGQSGDITELEGKVADNTATIEALSDTIAVNGAHNLLPLTLENLKKLNTNGTWSGNVYTLKSVTFTIVTDSDGSITEIVTAGIASEHFFFYLGSVKAGSYIVNGCNGGNSDTYSLRVGVGANRDFVGNQFGGVDYSVEESDIITLDIAIHSDDNMTNVVFKPQIRLATDPSTEYTPYAMTNKELTKRVSDRISFVSGEYFNEDKTYVVKNGNVKMLQIAIGSLSTIVPSGDWVHVLTLPSGYEPYREVSKAITNPDGHHYGARIDTDGKMYIYNYVSNQKIDGNTIITFI